MRSNYMQDIYEFREKGNLTSALIIIELLRGKRKLREISTDLKITPQGASVYLKNLQKNNFVDSGNTPTPKGVAFLQQILSTISQFVENAYEDTGIISSCEAIAWDDLKKGDMVSLSMKKGILYASRRGRSGSNGIADFNVKKGEPVRISNIEGIINHKVGEFYVMSVDFDDLSAKGLRKLKNVIDEKKVEYVGAYGVLAYEMCNRAGIKTNIYAPVEGCIEAGAKGLTSLLVYSPEMARFFFQKLSANIHKYKINPKFVEI
jgi:putative transcriptional regulator